VAGFGRWHGYSAGSIPGRGVPGRSNALGEDPGYRGVGRTGKAGRPRKRPDRLVADRGYDSNKLRAALVQRGIEPIIPARRNNRKATHQDGRKLRRYRHRWIVERTFAWLGHFRRLVVRYERLVTTYSGLFHLACAMLTLKRVLK
jgi:transposase